jgi:hypothetical protein
MTMKAMWMVTGMLATGILAAPAPSQAGVRLGIFVGHNDYAYGGSYRIGYDRGYEEGLRCDVREGYRADYNFWRDPRYRNGDAGYRSSYGPRSEYVYGYRRGYELGHQRSYAELHRREQWRDRDRDGRRDRDFNDRYGRRSDWR